jgi:hypothetical protein
MNKVDEIMAHASYAYSRFDMLERRIEISKFRTMIEDAVKVPAGWKLVPIEPTPEMIEILADSMDGYDNEARLAYAEMLSACGVVR